MPLRDYGVLVARAVDQRREGGGDSPHFQIHVVDDAGVDYRIAVNVQSQQSPSELLYLADDDFAHPILATAARRGGWTPLPGRPGGAEPRLHPRQPLRPSRMRLLPPDVRGPDNDLADLLGHYVARADRRPGRPGLRLRRALGTGADDAGQDLRLPARQRRPRHPHEPGQQRPASPATTASGRTAACCCTSPARTSGSRSSSPSRARPGTPTTRPATPSPGRPEPGGPSRRGDRPVRIVGRPGQPGRPGAGGGDA